MCERKTLAAMAAVVMIMLVSLALPAGAQVAAFVELARPQCDDQGHYVAVTTEREVSIMGFVALRSGLREVMVNGIDADYYPASYRVLNAPADYTTYGFRVPTYLQPTDVINVEVVTDDGYNEDYAYIPATDACIARIRYLRDRYADDYWWNLRLGNSYAFEDEFTLALPFLNLFVEREPRFWGGPFFTALAYRDRGDFDDADRYFRRVFDIEPRFYPAYLARGEMWEQRGRWDDARRDYDEALRMRPDSAEAHWRLGNAYLGSGDRQHAQENFNAALQRNPNLAVVRHSLGTVLTQTGQTQEAADQARQALRQHPNLAPAHAQLGNALSQQGKLPQAEAQYRAAMRANPQAPDVHMGLANTLGQQGRPVEALHEYRRAVQVSPTSPEARQALSQAEFQQGNYQQAWTHAHAAQQLGAQPNPQFLQQLRQKMPEPPQQRVVQPAPQSQRPQVPASLRRGPRRP